MSNEKGCAPPIRLLVFALMVVGLGSSMFAQTVDSLVQQWTEKRIEVERIAFGHNPVDGQAHDDDLFAFEADEELVFCAHRC